MIEIIIGIAVVLVLAILFLLFRINTLIGVLKDGYTKRAGFSNKINGALCIVFILVGLVLFFWYSNEASKNYLPKAVSIHGVRTDLLFWVTMAVLCFAFILTNIFLFVFAFKYQYKEGRKAYFYPDNHKLEFIWTVIPAIVMAVLVFYGWREWSEITKPEPENSHVVEIMGKQFAWQVRYPGKDKILGSYNFQLIDPTNEFGINLMDSASYDDFMPTELHVPKGEPVLLRIRARDVIHSVFAPHFRLKMDAVPGMPTKFWFVPTKTTSEMREDTGNPDFNYEIACTEVCGRGHFAMRFILVVDEPEEYEKWYAAQKTFVQLNKDYVVDQAPKNMHHLIPQDSVSVPIQNTSLPENSSPSDTSKKNNNLQALNH